MSGTLAVWVKYPYACSTERPQGCWPASSAAKKSPLLGNRTNNPGCRRPSRQADHYRQGPTGDGTRARAPANDSDAWRSKCRCAVGAYARGGEVLATDFPGYLGFGQVDSYRNRVTLSDRFGDAVAALADRRGIWLGNDLRSLALVASLIRQAEDSVPLSGGLRIWRGFTHCDQRVMLNAR
jgi:hypothetical protein